MRFLAKAAAVLLVSGMAMSQAQASSSLKAFLAVYRCPVVDRLDRVYSQGNPAKGLNRYLAVTVPEHVHGYVQCIFNDHRTKLLCEASSGFYSSKPGEPRTFRLEADRVAALAALGFSTDDTKGNFRIERDVAGRPDFNAIADLMLTALHDGYGARAHSKLQFNAPFARHPTSKCVPVS